MDSGAEQHVVSLADRRRLGEPSSSTGDMGVAVSILLRGEIALDTSREIDMVTQTVTLCTTRGAKCASRRVASLDILVVCTPSRLHLISQVLHSKRRMGL